MKDFSEKNIIVDKNINMIFEELYIENDKLLSNSFNIIKYEKNPWVDGKKIDIITILFEDIPDILSNTFLNNSKIITIKCKNKIIVKTNDEYTISTKFKIISTSNLIKLANILKLINIINTINLVYISENKTIINVNTKIKTYIVPPYSEILEIFAVNMCEKILRDSIQFISA